MILPTEKCAVVGVYLDKLQNAPSIIYNLLLPLYHRGHDGAGIAIDVDPTIVYKGKGLVRDVFKAGGVTDLMRASIGTGHTRYGTVGSDTDARLHPISSPRGRFYIAHNGTISPYEYSQLRNQFPDENGFDTQVLSALLEDSLEKTNGDWVDALSLSSERLDGSYTCTVMQKGRLVAFREPRGFKPLSIGEINDGYAIASETVALKTVGATNIQPVKPGEIVIIDKNGLRREQYAEAKPTPCSFEFLYFSDVSSVIDGVSCYDVRTKVGSILARKHPVNADAVMAVPESGRAGAIGYAHHQVYL